VNYLDELRAVIKRLHGVEATHLQSVPVKETFQGKTILEGVVEVFELKGHPKTDRVYAWSHDTGNPKKPKRHVTVLHIAPILSAEAAVKAVIVQEFKNLEPSEEN
jgi:hypothetical protein